MDGTNVKVNGLVPDSWEVTYKTQNQFNFFIQIKVIFTTVNSDNEIINLHNLHVCY